MNNEFVDCEVWLGLTRLNSAHAKEKPTGFWISVLQHSTSFALKCAPSMASLPVIILISNCAATKRSEVGDPVQLRGRSGTLLQRFGWWRRAIDRQHSLLPARDCYAGGSWSQIVAAESALDGRCKLWVVSAGLGLIPADLPIPNYSATFASNDPDSVASDRAGRSDWWNLLVKWGQATRGIGSISDLARANPKAAVLVAVSSTYLKVIEDDLIEAQGALVSRDNLLVISAGAKHASDLGTSLLPIDARFEHLVGGARTSLNGRILRHIVEKHASDGLSASRIAAIMASTAKSLKAPRTFDRSRLTDKEVSKFIRDYLRQKSPPSASALLRILRDSGLACEQKRFHRIFQTVHSRLRK